MGLFLALSGVVGHDGGAVRDAIAAIVAERGGQFEPRIGTTDEENIGVISTIGNSTSVLYPDAFTDWEEVSKQQSTRLNTTVFSFHIHDGDLWMFVAYRNGNEVAWFNPIPDYWEEVSVADFAKWSGDAGKVASLVPGVNPASIERYFCTWDDDNTTVEEKAYDDDEFPIGIDWQLTDFMRRLGFTYPIDDVGQPIGDTFYLNARRRRTQAPPVSNAPSPTVATVVKKPWWRFW